MSARASRDAEFAKLWLFDVIPFAFIGTFILVLALWGTKQR